MAQKIPPAPIGALPGSSYWNDWVEKLRNLINSGTISQLWASIDFTASNITDIVTRNHNNLQSFQGGTAGEYYHLTAAQHAALAVGNHNDLLSKQGGAANEYYHLDASDYTNRVTQITKTKAGVPTTGDIAAGNWAIYKDTSGGTIKLYANDGGTIKSVALT